jgi:hypothetical protein
MTEEFKPVDIEIVVAEATPNTPKEKRGGRRPGAGRPALVRLNKERMAQGLEPIEYKKNKIIKKRKSDAILPVSKKARAQEILAEMLGRESKYIVEKVLFKALDDTDDDQMACLKIVMDRILPADYLEKAKGSNKISIQIMGVGDTIIHSSEEEDIHEAEYEEVKIKEEVLDGPG